MVMACTGHTAKQAPQPVQLLLFKTRIQIPPSRGGICIALVSQGSKQLRHSTPWYAMQAVSLIDALIDQGVSCLLLSNACSLQTSTHCSQNRHSPEEKSITGKLARADLIMCVGHCEMQSPQFVQISTNKLSFIAHGGRSGVSFPLKSPRRNCILLTCALINCYRVF